MVWCIEQAECAEEVVDCLAESLSILEVRCPKRTTTFQFTKFSHIVLHRQKAI